MSKKAPESENLSRLRRKGESLECRRFFGQGFEQGPTCDITNKEKLKKSNR